MISLKKTSLGLVLAEVPTHSQQDVAQHIKLTEAHDVTEYFRNAKGEVVAPKTRTAKEHQAALATLGKKLKGRTGVPKELRELFK